MGVLDDDAIEARAQPIVKRKRVLDTMTLYERAAQIEDTPSPAMLESTAEWLAITDDLAMSGFTPEQILRVACRARRFGVHLPNMCMLAYLFDGAPELARLACDEIIANTDQSKDRDNLSIAAGALTCLAKAGPLELRFARLFGTYLAPSMMRTVVSAIPVEHRVAIVLPHAESGTARHAAYTIDKLLWITDLVPEIRAKLPALLQIADGDRDHAALVAETAAGSQRVFGPRPTPLSRQALAYWEALVAKRKRDTAAYDLAMRAYSRSISVNAPELATFASWGAASPKRQKQIAAQVARACAEHLGHACKVVDIAPFGGPPIATISAGKLRFCLVPGGSFEMGLSEEEEAAVRASSETNTDSPWAQYEQLLEMVHVMRPVTNVRVGPMLVQQTPGRSFELDTAADILETGSLRVPSEAEWEYCARGGKVRELTYRGDVLPDDEGWLERATELGLKAANQFGLFGFGFEPEMCADVWHETLDDHPIDGSPRIGVGERVVRGGAAQWYPWQSTGEWHMLLSAYRMPASVWGLSVALRFVLGIDLGATGSLA